MHNHGKQQTKQVFPLGRVFLANPVPGDTEVPYNCMARPVPSQSQNLEPGILPPCIHAFYPEITHNYLCHWYVTAWCPSDVMHNHLHWHVTMWYFDDVMHFLVGNPCACILVLEQKSLTQSVFSRASMFTLLSMEILIVTPSTYCDSYILYSSICNILL